MASRFCCTDLTLPLYACIMMPSPLTAYTVKAEQVTGRKGLWGRAFFESSRMRVKSHLWDSYLFRGCVLYLPPISHEYRCQGA